MRVSVRRFAPASKMSICAGNQAFPRRFIPLELTLDVWRPLTSAGEIVAAASKEPEGMEARLARLESDVAHIRSDVGDLRSDVRSLRDKIDALRDKMDERFERVDERISALAESLAAAKIWALVLYI